MYSPSAARLSEYREKRQPRVNLLLDGSSAGNLSERSSTAATALDLPPRFFLPRQDKSLSHYIDRMQYGGEKISLQQIWDFLFSGPVKA